MKRTTIRSTRRGLSLAGAAAAAALVLTACGGEEEPAEQPTTESAVEEPAEETTDADAVTEEPTEDEAIELLDKGFRWPKRPLVHHLRRAYALADLHERAGDVPRARSLFARIAAADPDFGDVEERRDALA